MSLGGHNRPAPPKTMNLIQKLKLLLMFRRAHGDIEKAGGMEGKLTSRKWWLTVAIACVGVIANALGVTPEHWQPIADWLTKILFGYLASQGAVDVAKAVTNGIAAKKNGGTT